MHLELILWLTGSPQYCVFIRHESDANCVTHATHTEETCAPVFCNNTFPPHDGSIRQSHSFYSPLSSYHILSCCTKWLVKLLTLIYYPEASFFFPIWSQHCRRVNTRVIYFFSRTQQCLVYTPASFCSFVWISCVKNNRGSTCCLKLNGSSLHCVVLNNCTCVN